MVNGKGDFPVILMILEVLQTITCVFCKITCDWPVNYFKMECLYFLLIIIALMDIEILN